MLVDLRICYQSIKLEVYAAEVLDKVVISCVINANAFRSTSYDLNIVICEWIEGTGNFHIGSCYY